ncbi:hypothetical protein [Marinobacterium sedimentorum]|uniref:hypothetical protein n=1 Tax=Marinobacterium sedimentorum TaxID=2927804 RepID=UPI0020C72DB3|nr:hypothetical protein [Marinobacterium sedimentorum]MCP8686884.1 hypothetical protein [Marinobacterium sedimentorum]
MNISHQVNAAPATIEMLFCFCPKERFVPPKIRNSITERSLSFLQSTFAIRPFASFKFDNFQRGQRERTKKHHDGNKAALKRSLTRLAHGVQPDLGRTGGG